MCFRKLKYFSYGANVIIKLSVTLYRHGLLGNFDIKHNLIIKYGTVITSTAIYIKVYRKVWESISILGEKQQNMKPPQKLECIESYMTFLMTNHGLFS